MAIRRSALGLLALAAALVAAPATQAATGGPALQEPTSALAAALECSPDPASARRDPVLLVHGTSVTPEENWSWGYQHDLLVRGHAVCTVRLPDRARVDTQRSVEYVVYGLRELSRRSGGRPVSALGHSQGGALLMYAMRVWPDLAPSVDDVIGIAGVYGNGSEAIRADCRDGCSTPFWQFATGSRLLAALAQRPLPAGPSYTALASLADKVVTPQPKANALPGGRSIQIQDVCPGRRAPDQEHLFLAGDAVVHALVIDALGHPGPADPARIDRQVCDQLVFPGVDPVGLALVLPTLLTEADAGPDVAGEPAVRCAVSDTCATTPTSAGRLLRSARRGAAAIRRTTACRTCPRPASTVVTVRSRADGQVRLSLTPLARRGPTVRTGARRVRRGQTLRIALRARPCQTCRTLAVGRYRIAVQTRRAGAPWRTERTLALRITAR